MDKIKKLLKKISKKDRTAINAVITILHSGKNLGLDIYKIKGTNFYRVRIKNFRIIFIYLNNKIKIIDIKPRILIKN